MVQFFDSFLQEKNIKWILSAGMLILLGSSLMMVTRGWDEFAPTFKFLIIVGYTAAIFGSGHWSYHKLGLRKTGTSLLALTVGTVSRRDTSCTSFSSMVTSISTLNPESPYMWSMPAWPWISSSPEPPAR